MSEKEEMVAPLQEKIDQIRTNKQRIKTKTGELAKTSKDMVDSLRRQTAAQLELLEGMNLEGLPVSPAFNTMLELQKEHLRDLARKVEEVNSRLPRWPRTNCRGLKFSLARETG